MARGEVLRVEVVTGALVQPTSSYLHQMSGAALYLPILGDRGFVQGRFVARPEHRSAGYAHQDQLWSVVAGIEVPFAGGQFHTGFGFGRVSGSIRSLADENTADDLPPSSYDQGTANVALGYTITVLSIFSLGLRHETAIGLGDSRQRKAFVSWPFQTYSVAAGVSL